METPDNNDFGIAEEVTVRGQHTKRPDIVLYVNGIALGVLELKRSTVSVSEGIRQNLDNQGEEFIRPFFATVQLLMAGNESEGLRYSVIESEERYWLRWKASPANGGESTTSGDNPLLQELCQLCSKARLLELIHDFTVFDSGKKKICRHNQFFGVKAAQERVKRREGGILWHTQGSGKSLTMVWLAKWIREKVPNSRVLILTDRTELDEQIESVFKGVEEEHIYRTRDGADLVNVLGSPSEWLVCSLIHKFGASAGMSSTDIDNYLEEIHGNLPEDFHPAGEFFVFIDECHRTQSGKLHKAMKALLPGAMLIGFTGTPLLKTDKAQSIETFGPYIHTYKYDEAVGDNAVLDLLYEARDIDQEITSEEKIDQWFELKTQGLTELAKEQLMRRWGTMRRVLSTRERLNKIVADIVLDMQTRGRLKSGRGNAMLVCDDIYSACRFFQIFRETELKGKCAIVTSYNPTVDKIRGEETGEGDTEQLLKHEIYREMLVDHFNESEDSAVRKVELFEKEVKRRFVDEPGQMKLLIVVDKLLTGFDAPPATYLYIDKHMQDHGLFQAICRVNRLHGEDKEYGYIIDYKDLFRSLQQSIADYTGEAFSNYDTADVKGLLKNRIQHARERLEERCEAVRALCEPVEPPRDSTAYMRFFCTTESGNAEQLKANEQKRLALYRQTAALVRAYANLANEMQEAGYNEQEIEQIKTEVAHYQNVRQEIKLASGDYIDLKMYEPAMRHLLDTYIRAEESETLVAFEEKTLMELIVEHGRAAIALLPERIRTSEEGTTETIENNIRRLIIDKMGMNPKYYERMSKLLDELIRKRKRKAIAYNAYLEELMELINQVNEQTNMDYPASLDSDAQRALYDNLPGISEEIREETALALHRGISSIKKADWRGHSLKEREIKAAIETELKDTEVDVDAVFEVVKNQDEY